MSRVPLILVIVGLAVGACSDAGLDLGPGEVLDLTGSWTLSLEKRSNPNAGCQATGIMLTIDQLPDAAFLGDSLTGVTVGGEAGCPGGPGPVTLSNGTLAGYVARIEDFEGKARVDIELTVTVPGELTANIAVVTTTPPPFETQGSVPDLLGTDVGIAVVTLERR